MSLKKYGKKIPLSLLSDQLSALIQEHDEKLKPVVEQAREALQELKETLSLSHSSFVYLINVYQRYTEKQFSVGLDNRDNRQQFMLTYLNAEVLAKLPEIRSELSTLDIKIRALNQKIALCIGKIAPLITNYNSRLKDINDNLPTGFFKSKLSSQIKDKMALFCARYIGKHGFRQILKEREDVISSFDKAQEMLVIITRKAEQLQRADAGSHNLWGIAKPCLAQRRCIELSELEISPHTQNVRLLK